MHSVPSNPCFRYSDAKEKGIYDKIPNVCYCLIPAYFIIFYIIRLNYDTTVFLICQVRRRFLRGTRRKPSQVSKHEKNCEYAKFNKRSKTLYFTMDKEGSLGYNSFINQSAICIDKMFSERNLCCLEHNFF